MSVTTIASWIEQALCVEHPTLPPAAWHGVQGGYLTLLGAKAFLVCRQCPVKVQCRESYPREHEAVLGEGWFTEKGKYKTIPEGHMDAAVTAAYLGMPKSWVTNVAGGHRLPVALRIRGRTYFTLDQVKILSRKVGPTHGTTGAYELHLLRGERVCRSCAPVSHFVDQIKERAKSSEGVL